MGVIRIRGGAAAESSSGDPASADQPPRLQEVLDVAGRLFHEKGYRSTSLADIGGELGMNKASLYHYFKSKEDLARQLILRASRRLRDVSRSPEIDALQPVAALEMLVREHCAVILRHPNEFGLLIQQRRFVEPGALVEIAERERTYLAHVRGVVARGIADGSFREMDPGIATALVMDSINGLLRWYRPGGRLSATRAADEIWEYVRAGISSTKAARRTRT